MRLSAHLILLILVSATSANAHSNTLKWNGFATVGVVATDSDNGYLQGMDNRTDFSYDSKLGLNLAGVIDETFSYHAQIVATGETLTPDWYFLSVSLHENLRLHVGKQKLQSWLYSDTIDVGTTYPWVRPPGDIYALNPILAFDGVTAMTEFAVGSQTFSLELAGGQLAASNSRRLPLELDIESRSLYGAVANWKGSYFHLRSSYISADLSYQDSSQGLLIEKMDAEFYEVGLKLDYANLLFITEFVSIAATPDQTLADNAAEDASRAQAAYQGAVQSGQVAEEQLQQLLEQVTQAGTLAAILDADLVKANGWYTTLGYQIGPVMPHVTYTQIDVDDDSLALGSQSTSTFGILYEFNLKANFKAQVTQVSLPDDSTGFFDAGLNGAGGEQPELDDIQIYSASFNVVF